MGAVYQAEDLALHRKVALKLRLPEFVDDGRARARFQREIDHAVAIEHPHVVPVYAAGFERPQFYIAMRLVPGPDLHRIVRDGGALEESRTLRIHGQVASALHAVHTKDLVHRDVKPHNVLLWEAGSDEEHAMLTDFGIAKALDDTHSLTGLAAIGTPGYMAPELSLGHLATPACDQYSLVAWPTNCFRVTCRSTATAVPGVRRTSSSSCAAFSCRASCLSRRRRRRRYRPREGPDETTRRRPRLRQNCEGLR
jgi:serine/threonine protein kinase